jgi:hypothetical protein
MPDQYQQRHKGRWHYHADLHGLEPAGCALGYVWEPYFSKRPCEVCNDGRAGDRVLCYGSVNTRQGQARLTKEGQPVELSVCLPCLLAWQ